MKNLFNQIDKDEILTRVDKLEATSQRLWGKMEIGQMLAHCSVTLEVAVGQKVTQRVFLGKLLAGLFKWTYRSEKPFGQESPTGDFFKITDQKDFVIEKQRLIDLIQLFQSGGESKCTKNPHYFFGNITPTEWGVLMYKHLDHHLKQFNV